MQPPHPVIREKVSEQNTWKKNKSKSHSTGEIETVYFKSWILFHTLRERGR
ncbi:hypothetical protein SK128_020493 [Halocaridina rubra]|uniref:Uncharacterized protein n=1 Tax=Halocaridina rubra TaxID=373956 RepID=A0AAN8WU03_HALRR